MIKITITFLAVSLIYACAIIYLTVTKVIIINDIALIGDLAKWEIEEDVPEIPVKPLRGF